MIDIFNSLEKEVDKGIIGGNNGISLGLPGLDRYISIRKRIYTLIFGSSGCLSHGTKIIMYDGTMKEVQDVKVGDKLMGVDSTPRTVLELKRGFQQMYWINQNKGIDYRVNEDHILHLRRRKRKILKRCVIPNQNGVPYNKRKREIEYGEQESKYINITVKDFLKKSKSFQKYYKGYKVGIEFPKKDVKIDPYFIGLWLGDGTSTKTDITTSDFEIVDYLKNICENLNLQLKSYNKYKYSLTNIKKGGKPNILRDILKYYNLFDNKHIPDDYLYNNKENRLKLLAGLLDSDGWKGDGGYYITQKNERLSKQINYLIQSLGFYSTVNSKIAKMKKKDNTIYTCKVFTISCFGKNVNEIPCKVQRKKQTIDNSKKHVDSLSTGITIKKDIADNYYGFTIDKDNLFLLEDFTVTHNTGKSSLANCLYILNPFDWYWKNKHDTKIKLKIVYFSMERSSVYVTAKWLVRKIFLNEGILIPLPKLMGWWDTKLTKDEHDLFLRYRPYFSNMEDIVEIIDGGTNPTGIYKWIKNYAAKNGRIEKISEFNQIYIPNDENLITIILVDHQSLIRKESGLATKKEAIDKLSEYLQQARDFYGFSPVLVAQMNRDIANPAYQKMDTFEPTPEQIKDSGTSFEDSDICMSLFDPVKFKTSAPTKHDANKLIDMQTGAKYYRSLKIHKNTWGEDDIRKGMAFHGAIGHFTELPKFDQMTQSDYDSILDGSYFLTK